MMKRRWMAIVAMMMLLSAWWAGSAMAQEYMTPDAASGQRVYDMAELLSSDAEKEMEAAIEEARGNQGFDIVVVTTEDSNGWSAQDYADDFYEIGDFGTGSDKSGILFLIDMYNRELTLSTDGKAIRVFTDDRIEQILDDVYEGASDGDFEASVWAFLEDVEYYADKGIQAGQYTYDSETGEISVYKSIRWYELLLALGISALVAGGACLSVKRQYNMELDDRQRSNLNMAYRADCRFAYDNQTDQLVNKFVTTRIIPKNNGNSSSGSSRSSSRSSSGRSTTHRSRSGRSHGGGSRKF